MRQYIQIFNIFNWLNISAIKIISFDLVDLEKDDPGLSGLKNVCNVFAARREYRPWKHI